MKNSLRGFIGPVSLGHMSLETTLQNLRYACRSLRRSPGFTALVLATLALGIAASLSMFGLLRTALWRPLPHSFEQVSTLDADAAVDVGYQGVTEHVDAASISDDFLPLLGVHPALGRALDSRIDDYVADSVGDTRFILFVLAGFAAVAVLLAAVGLYGTLAYLTSQRTRGFGIRLALGSSVHAIVAVVMCESVLLASAGIAFGLMGAVACTRGIRGLLYGVEPLDTPTLLAVVALVVIVALAAAGIPAWRAATTDPQESLRTE
jgi:predicted lysophospholipase L1 biosynthesis ABC-type transport system permease subunit